MQLLSGLVFGLVEARSLLVNVNIYIVIMDPLDQI